MKDIIELFIYLGNHLGTDAIWVTHLVIILGLLYIIYWLNRERNRLLERIFAFERKMEEIVNKYEQSQSSASKAIASLKEVLIELKTVIEWRGKDD